MTDEPAQVEGANADPSRDRARIEPTTTPQRTDFLPILYLLGFVVLAGALYFLWQNPPEAHLAAQDAGKVDTLQAQVASLRDAVAKLEQQKPAASGPSTAEFTQLQQQVASLATRSTASADEFHKLQQDMITLLSRPGATRDEVQLLMQRVQSFERQEPNLQPLTQRIEALERRPQVDAASIDGKIAQQGDRLQQFAGKTDQTVKDLQAKIDELNKQQDALAKQQKTIADRAQLATRLQGAAAALAAGQKLGAIPGAPPALARFATDAPPTEASLRESFEHYANVAQQSAQPSASSGQGFGSRLWSRAQQSVTIRQGDRVLVGDPIAGVLTHAHDQLDNGDLAGAVATCKELTGPALTAMQPWIDRASSLLDARAALASMAAG